MLRRDVYASSWTPRTDEPPRTVLSERFLLGASIRGWRCHGEPLRGEPPAGHRPGRTAKRPVTGPQLPMHGSRRPEASAARQPTREMEAASATEIALPHPPSAARSSRALGSGPDSARLPAAQATGNDR